MVTIATRQTQLYPLTHAQVDANFSNLAAAVTSAQQTADAARVALGPVTDVHVLRWIPASEWSAIANGTSVFDCSGAYQSAINSAPDNSVIIGPGGTCVIASEISVANRKNLTFSGNGTKIKGIPPRFRSYFYLNNSTNIRFTGWVFDCNMQNLPMYSVSDYPTFYNCPIYNYSSSGTSVANCVFTNLYTMCIENYMSDSLTVFNTTFNSPQQTQNQRMEFVHIQTCTGSFNIIGNRFLGFPSTDPSVSPCGVFCSGLSSGQLIVAWNRFDYCARNNVGSHRLGVVDIYGDAQNVHVHDNIITNCLAQFMRIAAVRGASVRNNHVSMSPDCESNYSIITVESVIVYDPGQVGCQDIEVIHNIFDDPANRTAFGIGAGSYDWGAPSVNIRFLDNTFNGVKRSVYVYGPYQSVRIAGNNSRGNSGQIYVDLNNSSGITSAKGTEANSICDDLVIEGNITLDESGGGASNVAVLLVKSDLTPYLGKIGKVSIRKNKARAVSPNAGQAIAVNSLASVLQGRLVVDDNETDNYTYDWYIREFKEVAVINNRALNTSVSPYLDDGSNGNVLRIGNRYSTDPTSGVVSLSGGTANVTTSEIRTGDIVKVTRLSGGGTVGFLSYGSISNAVSFVINSSSSTDTSSVFWEIVH